MATGSLGGLLGATAGFAWGVAPGPPLCGAAWGAAGVDGLDEAAGGGAAEATDAADTLGVGSGGLPVMGDAPDGLGAAAGVDEVGEVGVLAETGPALAP